MESTQFLRMPSTLISSVVIFTLLNSLTVLAVSKDAHLHRGSLRPINLLEFENEEDEFSAISEYGAVVPKPVVSQTQNNSHKSGQIKGKSGKVKGGKSKGEVSVDPFAKYNPHNPYNPYNPMHPGKPNSTHNTTHHNATHTKKKPTSDQCPAHCSGNGFCGSGSCFCKEGFTGPDCSIRKCPSECNRNGHCVLGQCRCFAGWSGFDCSYRGCKDQCNHQGYCHIGTDRSACICFPGFNGTTCAIGPACGWGESGQSCSGNGVCTNQKCFCEDGFTGERCEQHVCPSGGPSKTMCSGFGVCNVNTGTCECEYPHFGVACENAKCPGDCSGNGECDRYGHCKCKAGFYGKDCSPTNCLDDCNDHGSCVYKSTSRGPGAQCICHAGWGPAPTHPEKANSCSERICEAGYVGKNCEKRVCIDNCNVDKGHGQCDTKTFTCACKEGWSGVSCQFKSCPDLCNHHGTCNNGVCNCKDDWSGKACEIAPKKCPNSCSSHGSCFHGKCFCDDGWTGKDCHNPSSLAMGKAVETPYQGIVCIPRCSENGVCMTQDGTNQCFCKDGWSGLSCDTYVHTPGNYRSLDGGASKGPAFIAETSDVRPSDDSSNSAVSQRLIRKAKKQALNLV